jgi:superfamily II DNA helicase RecQ
MQHKSPVVAIIGTGVGKSVLFMLPASISSGVTIVVVLLVAL